MNSIKQIREFICFNQKELIQYEYLVSEKHKLLRINIDKEGVNAELISNLIDDLLDIAYGNLQDILRENLNLINQIIFSIGIDNKPRIAIKTLENGSVLDFFRSHSRANLKTSSIQSNTGFSEIMSSSKIMNYLNNDIESDFLKGLYKNPRLKDELREKLASTQIEWKDCWIPLENTKDIFDYRSTLIIPMAIRVNENDSEQFLQKFSEKIRHSEGLRTVWGFLCFDYAEKNVFIAKEDALKDAGYIIADIISLYLMFFYNHVAGSETFKKAMKYINQQSSKRDEHDLPTNN